MELYELRPKTLQLLDMLRTAGTIGPNNYERGNGKTTALLLYAKELLDKAKQGEHVVYAYFQPHSMNHNWMSLFPNAKNSPIFTNRPPHTFSGLPRKTRLLVDEPRILRWTDAEWRDAAIYRAITVGDSLF